MIVYDDPQFQISSTALLCALRQCSVSTRAENLDELRRLLVQTGQFEQALADLPANPHAHSAAQKATDLAATAFYAAYARGEPELPAPSMSASEALEELRQAVAGLAGFPEAMGRVKIPEGFEFYALYPEQYCHSARQWSSAQFSPRRNGAVLVIGIRSIGTALSALAAVTLKAAGWQTARITVRPSGPPFARRVELPGAIRGRARHALVVDEGPGISGSSMAAVAQALAGSGFKPKQISFLPGHEQPPGLAASDEVRRWWAATARHVTPLQKLRWNGLTLAESLKAKSRELLGVKEAFTECEDLSGGLWRGKIYRSQTAWPWTAIPFERMKYRCTTPDGRSILWKFAGFGAMRQEPSPDRQELNGSLAQSWTPKPLGWFRGFVALPWVEGKTLSLAEGGEPAIVKHIGRYIAAVSGPPLADAEQSAALARLREMLYRNAREALGDVLAGRALRAGEAVRKIPPGPSYGDGRLAPHKWLRTRAGQILKLDGLGHGIDHTMVGSQPVYWDIAGAMVEWNLSWSSCQPLLAAVEASEIVVCPETLAFFRLAYAAFRMGQASLCADACAQNASERARLQRAVAAYRADLLEHLLLAP